LKLPSDSIRRAKIAAAQKGTSLSALLLEKLEEALGEDAAYEAARRRAFKSMDSGWHLSGRPLERYASHG
jgi:hypothetical protein